MTEKSCKNCGAPWDGASPKCADCRSVERNASVQCVQCKGDFALRSMVLVTVRSQKPGSQSWSKVSVRYCSPCFGKLDAKLQEKQTEQKRLVQDQLSRRRAKIQEQLLKARQQERTRERERKKQDEQLARGRLDF